MSAESALAVPAQRRPISALDPAGSSVFIGRVSLPSSDPVNALAARMRYACATAVDVDEVAAILEANGINDRVAAREYGVPTVFALATRVIARTVENPPTLVDRSADRRPGARRVFVDTLIRSLSYVTPLGIAFGAQSQVRHLPMLATTGTLVLGWGCGQALAYLGYRVLNDRGRTPAARVLGLGFLGILGLWLVMLAAAGVHQPRALAVAAVQLVLFAVAAVALVTNRQRAVLAWTVPCWLSTVAVAAGLGRPAVAALLTSLAVLTAVAFRPALGGHDPDVPSTPARTRWQTWRADLSRAVIFGMVGCGQAVLLILVAFRGSSTSGLPPELIPLLIGVPLTELALVWHQRRVAAARAVLENRAAFDRRLNRLSTSTVAMLAVPVVVGAGIAGAAWLGADPPGGQSVAAAVLLTAVFALCLVLAAHRRPATAAILVWWPAFLIVGGSSWAPALVRVAPSFTETLAAATMLGASLPGLVVAAFVLRDPESYR
jgi:hypothetical protein